MLWELLLYHNYSFSTERMDYQIDSLTEINNDAWKQGKVIDLQEQSHDLPSEHLKKKRTSRELELVIFGDSITKYIIPENICKGDPQHAVNLSKSGAKVKDIYEQLSIFEEEHKDTRVKNIIINVGANHLSRDNPEDTAKKT